MDYRIFLKYNQLVDNIKHSQLNIYFFLKDCGFQRLFRENGNRYPTPESQNMYNIFLKEIQQHQWKRNVSRNDYHKFLGNIFTKINFNNIDLESFMILKILTENFGIFGAFDDLTNKRIKYINDKINSLKANPHLNANKTNIFNIFQKMNTQVKTQGHHHNQGNGHAKGPVPQNTIPQNTEFDLPKPGTDVKKKKPSIDPEIARLNEIMKQMKLKSPIYITNMQPGQFYDPYINKNYIPKGVNPNIRLPISKKDKFYPQLRAIIEKEIILANQELDYHKIDMARNHLERAAYYLKNIID